MRSAFSLDAIRAVLLAACVALVAGPAVGQQMLDAGRLAGRWQGYETVMGGATIGSEVIFFPNGTYQRLSVLGDLMAMQWGNWEVAQNWLHFYPTDYEPKTYLGRAMAPPPSETWIVDYFDGMRIHATIAGSSEVNFQRVQ
ncbi:hypothetical protein N8I71_11100 [Roseibacterium sp. SDUM158016]|uniref:hypothetical protein n=1 Tax=Roseicyclus sediminis TaxID=2980997 RepID=UPI0021CF0C06|nr:hypothetical protein [Roseibacterium sp. SDUM158016]MCU4653383.1 hypothetical protein [Roseibacterium sp. SDUM158016]